MRGLLLAGALAWLVLTIVAGSMFIEAAWRPSGLDALSRTLLSLPLVAAIVQGVAGVMAWRGSRRWARAGVVASLLSLLLVGLFIGSVEGVPFLAAALLVVATAVHLLRRVPRSESGLPTLPMRGN